jgi:hypothetical protein
LPFSPHCATGKGDFPKGSAVACSGPVYPVALFFGEGRGVPPDRLRRTDFFCGRRGAEKRREPENGALSRQGIPMASEIGFQEGQPTRTT